MNTIQINIPYAKRHLRFEIKERGGRFNPASKDWTLEDTPENRTLAQLISKPVTGPTALERTSHIANTCVELLNTLKIRNYRLVEVGERVVLESDALPNSAANEHSTPLEIR